MKRFQKAVINFRSKIGVPTEGLQKEKRASWYKINYTYFPDNSPEKFSREPNQQLIPTDPKFRSLLRQFAKSFGLDEIWYDSLFTYLLCDDQIELDVPDYEPYLEVRVNDARLPAHQVKVTSIKVNIDSETKLNDVRNIWSKIKKLQKRMLLSPPKRRRTLTERSVNRYLKVRDLEDSGKKHREIADMLDFPSAEDVAAFKRNIERFSKRK